MASKVKSVWGIDIGNHCLKAIRMRQGEENLEVSGVDRIDHSMSLLAEGVDNLKRNELIAETIRKFVEKNNITKADEIAISVPGQSSFGRFINLPPVEPKEIPKIVQYEAVQQIPFDINEVEWDWQLMEKPNSPETEVGIFAIKNEIINNIIEPFQNENMKITTVQMAPMSLYNYACHEFKELDDQGTKAVIVLNMGSESTELVVCSKTKVWQRVIPIGGNNFTQAIADAFKVTFEKAEKLKRSAPMSKYAKQIFHAMRPVFTDMGSEIQRSVGYFSSQSRGLKFVKVIALGGAMKLQGVSKYLQQSLQIPVTRPEAYAGVSIAPEISAAAVHENIGDLGTAYGLAVQGLGQAKISSNLLPRRIARSMAWARKSQIMMVAAAILLVVSFITFSKTLMDKKSYERSEKTRNQIESIIKNAEMASRKLKTEQGRENTLESKIGEQFEIFKYREVIPEFKQTILKCFPNQENNPSQTQLYEAFQQGSVDEIISIPRKDRKQMFITGMKISYAKDLRNTAFGVTQISKRGTSGMEYNGMGGMPPGMPPGMQLPGGLMRPGVGGGAFVLPGQSSKKGSQDKAGEEGVKNGPGFIVEIEGYSPYENINELLDPIGVGNNKNKWGIVTRFKNLNDIVDGNSVFEILDTSNTSQFIQEIGEVDLEGSIPAGVGILKTVTRAEKAKATDGERAIRSGQSDVVYEEEVLIDPLTGEEISKTYVLDEDSRKIYNNFDKAEYNVNDHWFRIKAKFLWKESPEEKEQDSKSSKGQRKKK